MLTTAGIYILTPNEMKFASKSHFVIHIYLPPDVVDIQTFDISLEEKFKNGFYHLVAKLK